MRFPLTRVRPLALGAALALATVVAEAAPPAYTDQPAIRVRNAAGAVMLGVARAGNRLVAVGEHGLVALSDDGGKSWRQATSVPVNVTLTAVQFVDARRGWAVGHAGVILATQDGGATWRKQLDGLAVAALASSEARAASDPRLARDAARLVADGADKPFMAVHFSSPTRGIVVGAYGLIVATEDGGATWTTWMGRLDNPRGAHLYALGIDGQAIHIAGEQGVFFSSLDGGRSFQKRELPYKGSWFSLAIDGATLTLAGLRGNVFRSDDRGQTWHRLGEAPPVSFVSAVPIAGQSVLLANQAGQLFMATDGRLKPLSLPPVPPVTQAVPLGSGQVLLLTVQGILRQSATEVVQ
jgi:photosystem II stability/assembly factor-like uncharacterized protein